MVSFYHTPYLFCHVLSTPDSNDNFKYYFYAANNNNSNTGLVN